MVWASGQKLQSEKYIIEERIGEGGFGVTYCARDNNGRRVVIKTFYLDLLGFLWKDGWFNRYWDGDIN